MTQTLIATALSVGLLLAAPALVMAQTSGQDPHHPEADAGAASPSGPLPQGAQQPAGVQPLAGSGPVGPGMMGPGMMGPGMMGPGMMGMGQMPMAGGPMMPCPMMTAMSGMPSGMMSMMHGMMAGDGADQAGPGMMDRSQKGLGYGLVRPSRHLSVEDVRDHFAHYLERQDNPHLRLGDVKDAEAGSIIAEIVTTEGSLADRLTVDRHSGVITRVP